MAPGRLAMRVVRTTGAADAGDSGGPVSPAALRTLITAPFLDRAAEQLLMDAVDVVGHAATTTAYAIGFNAEMAMVSRLSRVTGRPVAAPGASAVGPRPAPRVGRGARSSAEGLAPALDGTGAS